MIIATSTVPFIPQPPAAFDEPPAQPESHRSAPIDQPLARSKRGIGGGRGFGWPFGKKPPNSPTAASVPISKPKPDPKPTPSAKPGPAPKPQPCAKPSVESFKGAGQAVILANKIKVNDERMMANLRKQAPISVAEAAKRLIDAESLVKAGVISTGPNASRVARDAFISAGITGMVSAPINVAAYAGSVAAGESIKSSYAPGVLPPPFLPSAANPSKANAPLEQRAPVDSFSTRLEDVEMRLLGMGSTVMFMLGDTGSVFTKDETWPTETAGRLSNMEKLLAVSEQHLKKAARQNGLIFRPYKPGALIPTETKERLELIEKKFERMVETYEKLRFLAAMKNDESKNDTPAIA